MEPKANKTSFYDLIVIGAGPAGYPAAFRAAETGKKVALIEKNAVGGVCLNSGCIPAKTLLHTSGIYRQMQHTAGITSVHSDFDMEELQHRRLEVIQTLQNGILSEIQRLYVDYIQGAATITAHSSTASGSIVHTSVSVFRPDSEEPLLLQTTHILIAGGSSPAILPVSGFDDSSVLTSTTLLEQKKLPESIIIVGGGVIGIEFAQFYSDMNIPVTILEACPRILPQMDVEISRNLAMILSSRGVQILCGVSVKKAEKQPDGSFIVSYSPSVPVGVPSGNSGDAADGFSDAETINNVQTAQASVLLCAAGRKCRAELLFAPELIPDVKMHKGMLVVDDRFETSIPGIYAAGDIIGGLQLAHTATAEGLNAVAAMFDECSEKTMTDAASTGKAPKNTVLLPSCIYTDPEVACVGISPEDEKNERASVKSVKALMRTNGKSVLEGGVRGFVKLIFRKDSRKLIGARLMCSHATDILPALELAIASGLTADKMASIVYPHPTIAEAIGEAAEAARKALE